MKPTDEWYDAIAAESHVPAEAARQLRDNGFVVLPGPAIPGGLERLSAAYDRAVATADAADVRVSSSTRVTDFVSRGPEFDGIYVHAPLLAACCLIVGRPFKLSGTHREPCGPRESLQDPMDTHERQVLACGPAGSMIIFDGSVWHGYTANGSARPRRSLQGHFVARDARASVDHAARIGPQVLQRIGNLAKYILDVA